MTSGYEQLEHIKSKIVKMVGSTQSVDRLDVAFDHSMASGNIQEQIKVYEGVVQLIASGIPFDNVLFCVNFGLVNTALLGIKLYGNNQDKLELDRPIRSEKINPGAYNWMEVDISES